MKKFVLAGLVMALIAVGGTYWFNSQSTPVRASVPPDLRGYEVATFAGGCFWCVEAGFEDVPGVKAAVSGYSGGKEKNPGYYDVAGGKTGHVESVQVYYDSKAITYEGLLQAYWRMIDPTDNGGQFSDRGRQYKPVIFYHNETQMNLAEQSRTALAATGRFDKPIKVDIVPFTSYYPAEERHQDYADKNPLRYQLYTGGSGRAGFVKDTWGPELKVDFVKYQPAQSRYTRPSDDEIKQRLTEQQYEITQNDGTEPPFRNAYWDEKRDGLYVDIVSGEPLFSSKDKFKSGTGWPSFTKPVEGAQIVEKVDHKLFRARVELRSGVADSHLGHVFDDGPQPTGKRYCINSAALKFIPATELSANGYGEYDAMFAMKGM